MRVIKNKYFLQNPEKTGTDPSYRFREKRKNRVTPTHFISKNDVTEKGFSLRLGDVIFPD